MKKIVIYLLLIVTATAFSQEKELSSEIREKQDAIIEEFVTNCAEKYNLVEEMPERQNCLDEGLKKDNTIASLWQQKAMAYFVAGKYEIGKPFLDKAVFFDAKRCQPYRAYVKCIFAKTYRESLLDFEDCIKKFGNGYVMDHTYGFYMGLCYLQLNEFEKAEKILQEYNDDIYKNRQQLQHPTALFYLGIAKYEQKKWQEAIAEFDKALRIYPNFSDAKYYKAICMSKLGTMEEATAKLYNELKEDSKKGYTINEYNTLFEKYPYQLKSL
jgi:tetratricopeptide (TPR) repeat protein